MCVIVMRKKTSKNEWSFGVKYNVLDWIWEIQRLLCSVFSIITFVSSLFIVSFISTIICSPFRPSLWWFSVCPRWISELRTEFVEMFCTDRVATLIIALEQTHAGSHWCVSVTACRFPPSALDVALILLWKSERRKLFALNNSKKMALQMFGVVKDSLDML